MQIKNTTKSLSTIVFFLYLSITGCILEFDKEMKKERIMTLEEVVEIGKKELKRVGYFYVDEAIRISADEKNTAWQKHVTSQPEVLQNETIKRMNLKKRNYWAIYYAPEKLILGGDAWVFVDRNSGKIIGVVFGK